MNTYDYLVGIILVLGVVILVHEWGHFIVARLFGVRVDVFSIGFGPRLFGIKRGATDYRVSALPLGGYIRMAGQDMTDIDSGDNPPTGAPDELMSKKRWQRALISFAGPAVNLIFPVFLLTGYALIRGEAVPKYLDQPLTVSELPSGSPAAKIGLAAGDRITSLNGVANPTWGALGKELEKGFSDRVFQVTYSHDGQIHSGEVSTAGVSDPTLLFGDPPGHPLVDNITDKDKPAYRAGIRRGDVIETINGKQIPNAQKMIAAIQENGGVPAQVTVRRGSQRMNFTITPVQGKNESGETTWQLGISVGPEYSFRKVGFSEALTSSVRNTANGTVQVIQIVGQLLTGKLAVRQLQSVVGIANAAGHAVQEGTYAVVALMAALSINLGVLNLLPIPILDGGHILLLALEGIRRRDFSMAFKERFIQVGLVFLLVLIVYVMYNDVVRMLPLHS
jgi:regulator of sigma E protease